MDDKHAAKEKLDEIKNHVQEWEEETVKVKAKVDEWNKLRKPVQNRIQNICKYKKQNKIDETRNEILDLRHQLTLTTPPLDDEIRHMEHCKEELAHKRTEKDQAQLALDLATATLKGEMDARSHKPVVGAIEDILAGINVVRQAHFGGVLQGNACQSLLVHHTDVLNNIGAAMKDPDLRRDVNSKEELDAKVDIYIRERIKIMDSLNIIMSLMSRQNTLATDEECDMVDDLCKQFGDLWRNKVERGTTIKMHLLESHLPLDFRLFRNIGDLLEDPIERFHHIDKVMRRQLAAIPGFEAQSNIAHDRLQDQNSVPIKNQISLVKRDRTRQFGPESLARKQIKVMGYKEDREDEWATVWAQARSDIAAKEIP
jgi:hypothetical protein